MGSLGVGWLQNIFPKRYILSAIYFLRAVSIVTFISLPINAFSAIMFGAVTGLTWLSTVPPTSALVVLMFGTRWFATLYGFAFVSHQVGGFLGVWLGGIVFEKFGSYTPIWWLSVLFGVLSALINLPIVERPVARATPVAQPT
jgi:predicted MFS family arabinose efflux permease